MKVCTSSFFEKIGEVKRKHTIIIVLYYYYYTSTLENICSKLVDINEKQELIFFLLINEEKSR